MEVSGHGGSRVRVRLAPSPTGSVHIGNVLVALVDAAIARKFNGAFVIRIEDTDQKRFLEGAEQLIYDSLAWLGIEWQEGPDRGGPFAPYRQSERLPRYLEVAEQLVAQGDAYRCWCSPTVLMRCAKPNKLQNCPRSTTAFVSANPKLSVRHLVDTPNGQ